MTSRAKSCRLSTVSACDRKPGLAHHEEVAEAAAMRGEVGDLGIDLIGRAAEHDGGIDQLLHAARRHVDDAAVLGEAARRGLALQQPGVVHHRQIARRIAELRRDDAREVRGSSATSSPRRRAFVLARGDGDETEIGEAVGRAARVSLRRPAFAIGVEERPRVVAAAERRDDIAALAQDAGIGAAAGRAPHRRMRLLIGPGPDVDVAILEVFALPVEGFVVARHRLDDEIVRLPEPLHDVDGVGVGDGIS